MFDAVSCWHFDWAMLGTWVGGLGSAAAAFAAVYVLREAAAERQKRKKALFAYRVHGVVSELERILYACMSVKYIFATYKKEDLDALLKKFSLDETSAILQNPEDLSVNLAHCLGRCHLSVNRLISYLEIYSRAKDDNSNNQNYEAIISSYLGTVKSICIRLADALIDDYPENEAELMRLQMLVESDDMLRNFSALAVREKMGK